MGDDVLQARQIMAPFLRLMKGRNFVEVRTGGDGETTGTEAGVAAATGTEAGVAGAAAAFAGKVKQPPRIQKQKSAMMFTEGES